MQAIPVALTALLGTGAPAAAAGTAAATGAGAAATGGLGAAIMGQLPNIMAAGSALGAVGQYASMTQQQQMAEMNAELAEENADRALTASQKTARDQDLDARLQIGDLVAQLSASGLKLNAGSTGLQQRGARELAARDRGYTIEAGETEFKNNMDQANDLKAQAKNLRVGKMFATLGNLAAIPTSYLSGASMLNKWRYGVQTTVV